MKESAARRDFSAALLTLLSAGFQYPTGSGPGPELTEWIGICGKCICIPFWHPLKWLSRGWPAKLSGTLSTLSPQLGFYSSVRIKKDTGGGLFGNNTGSTPEESADRLAPTCRQLTWGMRLAVSDQRGGGMLGVSASAPDAVRKISPASLSQCGGFGIAVSGQHGQR